MRQIFQFLAVMGLTALGGIAASAQVLPEIPAETTDTHTVSFGEAKVPTGTSRTVTYRPNGDGPFPTVYFLQGYTCSSVDHRDTEGTTRRALVEAYVQNGFLVFMVQKPGVGDSISEKGCDEINYTEEVAAFEAAYQSLITDPDVDQDNIFLFGHSMGGLTGPLIAQNIRTRGIITYGAVVKPWFEYMLDNFRSQAELFNFDPRDIQRDARVGTKFFYDLMIAKKDWEEIVEEHAEAIEIGLVPVSGDRMYGRHHSFWATLNDPDLVGAWADYEGKVLAIYGSYDIEAISPESAKRTARIVNTYHEGNARALILEEAEHGFARVEGPFEAYAASRLDGTWTAAKAFSQFDQRVVDETVSWMKAVKAEE